LLAPGAEVCLSIRAVMTRLPILSVLSVVWVFGTGGCGGAEDDRDPVWSYISPAIIEPNCATSSCHSQGSAVAGLNLSSVDAGYRSLLQLHLPLRGKDPPPVLRPLVTPGVPDESRIINMMRAQGSYRMPPDRPLAEGDIRLVERWILNGAKKD
jgi:hypothetical protein